MQKYLSIVIMILPAIVAAILRLRGLRQIPAWLLSCAVIPGLILIDEFLLPSHGGGASMWPVAVVFGGFYGAVTGGLGVVIASHYLKRKKGDGAEHK